MIDMNATSHVMVDIETFGTEPGSLILSLGAVKFAPNSQDDMDPFYVAIDLDSCKPYGFNISTKTISWWLDPDRAPVWATLQSEQKVDIVSALEGFCQWYGTMSLPTWGNGVGFDNTLLRAAFDLIRMEPPWEFWDDRCYRTLKNLVPYMPQPSHGGHHGLQDALAQAEHLRAIVKHLGLNL